MKNNIRDISRLETQAIDFIRSIARQHDILFLAYSGGKDSEVIYHLCKKAGIEFSAYFNNTTIDPPGTLSYVKSKGDVEIFSPQRGFFDIIRHRGLPSYVQRFCCAELKERYVASNVITGVRRAESTRRKQRYQEPETCRITRRHQEIHYYMPILEWTNEELKQYIIDNNIKCHPLYYDEDGNFNVNVRVGCMGCPLAEDRTRWFKKYPKLIRVWCSALADYRNSRPILGTTITNYRDEYENFYNNVFHLTQKDLIPMQENLPRDFARNQLQEYFNIELKPAKSPIEELTKRIPLKK